MWILEFDGLCEPNPGGLPTYGWVLLDTKAPDWFVTSGHGHCLIKGFPRTNNVAEYCALGRGLKCIQDDYPNLDKLLVNGDSKLVINQISGEWNCKSHHLAKLRDRVRKLIKKIPAKIEFEWVPRNMNERADALSNKAYKEITGRDAPIRRRK